MVFLPGYDYKEGDAMLYPGHIVAEKEIVMITLNYRLGAIGKCCTGVIAQSAMELKKMHYW